MKEILAELYNKVVTFFQTEKTDNSKEIASNRLKLVLMHDRTKLDPLTLERMRNELIGVISRYVVIDQEQLELNLAGEGDSIALMLNIPVLRAKTEEELELQELEDSKKNEQSTEEIDEDVEETEQEESQIEETDVEEVSSDEEEESSEDEILTDEDKEESDQENTSEVEQSVEEEPNSEVNETEEKKHKKKK